MTALLAPCACGQPAYAWCDWKVPENQHGLCNKPICREHALNVGVMKYLCPEHQKAKKAWEARRQREPGEEG